MKPLQLKMTAFGPYKFTETIDFTELKDNRLFVISGATGAGKTTIFDGICFALYGSGSGEDRRDTKTMRSDFATDDTHTSVELIFEIHGRTYRILRQLPHVKQGNKGATGERFEFFERKESGEIPVVERQIVSEINKKVEEIIGLTQEQFSQIVMLPQGEFRKLLTSPTENKEAILRKIFKTEPYKMISERLKDKKQLVEAELKKEELTRNGYTEQIVATLPMRESSVFELIESSNFNTFQLVDALKEETIFYKEKIQADTLTYNEVYEKHANKQVTYYEAKVVNERFIELEEKERRLVDLQKQLGIYEQKQSQLEAAERASTIEATEGYYTELKKEASEKSKLLERARSGVVDAEAIVKQVEITYTAEANKKEEREKSVEAVIQLNAFLPIFEELETTRIDVLNLEKNTAELDKQVQQKNVQFVHEKTLCTSQKGEIEKLEQLVEPLDQTVQRLNILQTEESLLRELVMHQSQMDTYNIQEIEQRRIFDELKEAYAVEEQKWMNNQASILAAGLVSGEACPVCGSLNHPTVHADRQLDFENENEVNQLKKQLSKQESIYLSIVAKKEAIQESGQKLAVQIAELNVKVEEMDRIQTEVQILQQSVKRMRDEKNKLISLKEPYKSTLLKVEKLEQEKIDLDQAYQQQKGSWEQAKAVYDSKTTSIPAHIPNLQVLYAQIAAATQHKEQLEHTWNDVQKKFQQAKELFAKEQVSFEHAVLTEKEISEKLKKAQAQFSDALANAGFSSFDVYTSSKLSEYDRNLLKQQCSSYKQAVSTLIELVKEGQELLAHKLKVELAPLEEELVQLKDAYEQALHVLNSSKEYEKAGLQLEEKITDTSSRISKLEQQFIQITDLYDMLRGQNHAKISFERYVQMEYLEQIVQAANERLKQLSNGQFYLIRSDRQETHGRQSGLGLDVYDAYTGHTRDVKTLSGGEKFNASLCLALGMADVIQSFQGSIRIDTMFIDEGFGSLDEESLNKAIDTLIDLQKSGRMIGVISHVAELKASIPAILEVEKLKEGYSKTRFVLR